MKHNRHLTSTLVLLIAAVSLNAQTITLWECFASARINSELSQNFLTLDESASLDESIGRARNLPSIQVSGQASYQSDVFGLPVSSALLELPTVPKDQYNLSLKLSQKLYDGGASRVKEKLDGLENQSARDALEIKLYELNSIISQLYFGVLQSTANTKVLEVKLEELKNQQKRIKAGLENGVVLPSTKYEIEKALIEVESDLHSLNQLRLTQANSLSSWIGQDISPHQFIIPDSETTFSDLHRPELDVFATSKQKLAANENMVQASKLPKVSAFASGGFGQPNPLNFMETDFNSYYMIGARLEWNVFDWGNAQNQRSKLALQQDMLKQEEAHFVKTINNQVDLVTQEIARLENDLYADSKQFELQQKIFDSDKNRFELGVLSASDYVSSLNELQQLDLQKELDRIAISMKKTQLLILTGNL
ncbi:MAG: TolC family protein [Cyclobacteriaceae bacterium]